MKFAYFYASSIESTGVDDLSLPPGPATLAVTCDEFPKKVDVVLNIAVIGIDTNNERGEEFSLEVDIFCGKEKVESYKKVYDPIRAAHVMSTSNDLASRYSFVDTFMAKKPGIYTFIANLYVGSVPFPVKDISSSIDKVECSVILSKDWL